MMYNAYRYNAVLYNYTQPTVQTMPLLIAGFAFGEEAFADSPSWKNANVIMRFDISRGRQHELNRVEAGMLTILFRNTDYRFWANYVSSPYYPDVKPGVRVNFRALFNGTIYDLFTGYVEEFLPGWLQPPNMGSVMEVRASDVIKNLSVMELNDAVGYSQELSGARIGNVLDDLSFPPADRDIDAGQSLMVAPGALANVKAMEHLFNVQESEFGILFAAGNGILTFHDRHARFKEPLLTSQAVFGDDAGEMAYCEVLFSYDDSYIFNDVRRKRIGGTEQVSSDATSQSTFGKRTNSKQDMLVINDPEAKAQADYLKGRYKNPALRVKQVKIYPQRDPSNLFSKVLSYDIGTKITIRLNEAAIDEAYHIEGITHSMGQDMKWVTTWQLTKAEAMFWVLGVAGFSELGETTILGY